MHLLPRRQHAQWVPAIAATVCAVLSVVNFLALFAPSLHSRLARELDLLPGVVGNAAVLATAVAGVLLWFIAGGLARRKRRAWLIAVLLLSLNLSVRLWAITGIHARAIAPILVNAALLIFLLCFAGDFFARSEPISKRRAMPYFAAMLVVGTGIGLLMVSVRALKLNLQLPLGVRLVDVWQGWLGVPNPLDEGPSQSDDVMYYALLGIGLAMGMIVLFVLLRAPRGNHQSALAQRSRIEELMTADSLEYFALRSDKSVLWSPSGQSGITYALVHGVMLASGDPIGAREYWPEAISTFMDVARQHAWLPGVAACSESAREAWKQCAGLESLEIGDEAIVRVADFNLRGNSKKNLRRQVNRATRSGVTLHVATVSELDSNLRAALALCAVQWRTGHLERGFSMALGRVCQVQDANCLIAWGSVGSEPVGVLQFLPWGECGWSLDVMRRSLDAPGGLMDALIVEVIQHARDTGKHELSLNFAPFRSTLDHDHPSAPQALVRVWRQTLLFASKWAQIESMYQFNSKYRPTWVPRHLMFANTRDFARVSTAYLRAEGFLTRPRWLPSRTVPERH
ncbi:MAG: phosphatidylglycerol lysyltransferase domain-containing protein [Actinomycetota bacterium]|nr:phosphatidylglycerol lysyltransferase domain-containing protein [Actinomycetota bacterium]